MNDKLHALILGATGATGKELINELLKIPIFIRYQYLERRVPDIENKKLFKYKIDFSELKKLKACHQVTFYFQHWVLQHLNKGGKTAIFS